MPTLVELGYPELVVTTWYSLSGPDGLPRDIVERLNREVNKAMELEGPRAPRPGDSAVASDDARRDHSFMKSEVDKWVPVVKAMNMQVQ